MKSEKEIRDKIEEIKNHTRQVKEDRHIYDNASIPITIIKQNNERLLMLYWVLGE